MGNSKSFVDDSCLHAIKWGQDWQAGGASQCADRSVAYHVADYKCRPPCCNQEAAVMTGAEEKEWGVTLCRMALL